MARLDALALDRAIGKNAEDPTGQKSPAVRGDPRRSTPELVATSAAKLLPSLSEMDQRRPPDLSENRL